MAQALAREKQYVLIHIHVRVVLTARKDEYNFLAQHIATLKLCDSLLHFHICEYRLLFCARYRSNGEPLDTSQPSELSYAFANCADVALALLEVFQTEFVRNGFLPFCFNLTWVGTAITSVWLIKVSCLPASSELTYRTLAPWTTRTVAASSVPSQNAPSPQPTHPAPRMTWRATPTASLNTCWARCHQTISSPPQHHPLASVLLQQQSTSRRARHSRPCGPCPLPSRLFRSTSGIQACLMHRNHSLHPEAVVLAPASLQCPPTRRGPSCPTVCQVRSPPTCCSPLPMTTFGSSCSHFDCTRLPDSFLDGEGQSYEPTKPQRAPTNPRSGADKSRLQGSPAQPKWPITDPIVSRPCL